MPINSLYAEECFPLNSSHNIKTKSFTRVKSNYKEVLNFVLTINKYLEL